VKFTTADAKVVGSGSGAVEATVVDEMKEEKSAKSIWIWIGAVRTSDGKGSAPPERAGLE
jgi:hypothetical protein